MVEPRPEQVIANFEMCCTVIGMQAERIAMVAAKPTDDVQRTELWSVTMELREETKMIRQQLLTFVAKMRIDLANLENWRDAHFTTRSGAGPRHSHPEGGQG